MNKQYHEAAKHLQAGAIIAYPTESVFGLGCNPADEQSVLRLFELKQRPPDKGVILIAANLNQLENYLDIDTTKQYPEMLASWPGPYTWLVPCKNTTPKWLRGNNDTLAVRITANQSCINLCNTFGSAIVSTSANISGHTPCKSVADTHSLFGDKIEYILDGTTDGLQQVTSIRDARTGKQIR